VFDQKVNTWLGLHQRALAFFGGVPRRVVLDYVPRNIIQLMCPS
jgi:transposase